MEELFDVYDINGNYIGVEPKSFCHSQNPGVYHKPVWIWIVNSKGQILLQKRASTKKFMPNKWDSAVTGHVIAGETSIDGCARETKEEIGLKIDKNRFEFLDEFLAQEVWEIGQVYSLRTDIDLDKVKVQREEVSEIKFVDFDKFQKLFFSDEFLPYSEEYKNWIIEKLSSKLI